MVFFKSLPGRKSARQRRMTWPHPEGDSSSPALALFGSSVRGSTRLSSGLKDVFRGTTIEELREYINLDTLSETHLNLLLDEMSKGESVLAKDESGTGVIRIVSVAKPLVFDASTCEILVEMFHTKLPPAELNCCLKATGMSEKFNPLQETSRAACGRALREELAMKSADGNMFAKNCLRLVEQQKSDKFKGLRCEYHLYIHMIKPSQLAAVRELIPLGQLSKVDETDSLNSKSIWWMWVPHIAVDKDLHAMILRTSQENGLPVTMEELEEPRKFGNVAQTIHKQRQLVNSYIENLMNPTR